jgi:hypothetical protein
MNYIVEILSAETRAEIINQTSNFIVELVMNPVIKIADTSDLYTTDIKYTSVKTLKTKLDEIDAAILLKASGDLNNIAGTKQNHFTIDTDSTLPVIIRNDNGAIKLFKNNGSTLTDLYVGTLHATVYQTTTAETLQVQDQYIICNYGVTGTPSLDAGLQVERGTSTNASIRWDESDDLWKAGIEGSETEILLNVLTAEGDLLYRDANGYTRLPKGTDGYYLKATATGLAYGALPTTVTLADDILDYVTDKYQLYAARTAGKLYFKANVYPSSTVNSLMYDGKFYASLLTSTGAINANSAAITNGITGKSLILTLDADNIVNVNTVSNTTVDILSNKSYALSLRAVTTGYGTLLNLSYSGARATDLTLPMATISRTVDIDSTAGIDLNTILTIDDSPLNVVSDTLGKILSVNTDSIETIKFDSRIASGSSDYGFLFASKYKLTYTDSILRLGYIGEPYDVLLAYETGAQVFYTDGEVYKATGPIAIGTEPGSGSWELQTNVIPVSVMEVYGNGTVNIPEGANYLIGGKSSTNIVQKLLINSQSDTFEQVIAANTKILSIDVKWVSGTPVIKCGTSAGTDNVFEEITLASGMSESDFGKTYISETTLYFTLAGGVVDIIILYISDYGS